MTVLVPRKESMWPRETRHDGGQEVGSHWRRENGWGFVGRLWVLKLDGCVRVRRAGTGNCVGGFRIEDRAVEGCLVVDKEGQIQVWLMG